MVQIFLLDTDEDYVRGITESFNKQTSGLSFVGYLPESGPFPPEEISSSPNIIQDLCGLPIPWDRSIVIYNPDQFSHLPDDHYSIRLTEQPSSDPSPHRIFKYAARTEWIRRIEDTIRCNPGLSEWSCVSHRICIAGTACPSLRRESVMRHITAQSSRGFRVILLDLSPPYCSLFPCNSAQSHTLSDALLKLSADDLPAEEIGHYLAADEGREGFFLFRPVEKTDDLFECKPDLFRKLLMLIGNWIASTGADYYTIIHCGNIPFSSIYAVSVLCDSLELIYSDRDVRSSLSYDLEMSYLLSNLPASCKLLRETSHCPKDENIIQ